MARYALNRDNTALLIIDIQEKLASIMKYKEQIIDNTKILITAAKEMNMPIIVTEQYPKGIGPTIADIKEAVDNKEAFEKKKLIFLHI